jgi:hypothetical protein
VIASVLDIPMTAGTWVSVVQERRCGLQRAVRRVAAQQYAGEQAGQVIELDVVAAQLFT